MKQLLVKPKQLLPGDVITKAIGEVTNDFSNETTSRIVTKVDEVSFTYIKFSGLNIEDYEYNMEFDGASQWYEVHRLEPFK